MGPGFETTNWKVVLCFRRPGSSPDVRVSPALPEPRERVDLLVLSDSGR
jgi:hypothetical protein